MANSLVVSALTDYVQTKKDELLVKATLGGKTLQYVEVMPSVKGKAALNYLDSTIVLGDGSVCGFDPQGEDIFSDKTIEVKPVKVEKEFCAKSMREKYMNYQLMFEAGRETLPFEQKISESNMNAIQDAVENLVWQGNSALTIDGFVKQISGSTSAIKVNFATGDTIVDKVDAVVAAVSERMLAKGVRVYIAPTDFRAYVKALNATCCANRQIVDAAVPELIYEGDSRIVLVPTVGLEGQGKIIAATPDALVYGTDIEGADNVYRLWYNEDEDTFRFRVLFNAGTALKYDDEIVLGA